VGYLQHNFWPRLAEGTTFSEANRQLQQWLLTVAGLREVRLFAGNHELVATHRRAARPHEGVIVKL
jgi:hypothetical protein